MPFMPPDPNAARFGLAAFAVLIGATYATAQTIPDLAITDMCRSQSTSGQTSKIDTPAYNACIGVQQTAYNDLKSGMWQALSADRQAKCLSRLSDPLFFKYRYVALQSCAEGFLIDDRVRRVREEQNMPKSFQQ